MASDNGIKLQLSSASKARLLQSYAKQQGRSISELLEQGSTIPQMVYDQLYGALGRFVSRNEIPETLITEAEAEANKAEAARLAAAPIPAGA